MIPIVFVHGTGVREPEFGATVALLQQELADYAEVRKCYWGDRHGSRLSLDGASIPDYTPQQGRTAVGGADEAEIELWRLLASDPLYELRLLAAAEASPPGFSLEASPGSRLQAAVGRLPESVSLQQLLAGNGLTGSFETVLTRTVGSDVYLTSLAGAPESLAEHRYAVARALTAGTAVEARRRGVNGGVPMGYRERTALVGCIVDELGGAEYGLLSWTWRNVLRGLVTDLGTRYLIRNRQVVSDAAWPMAGDVLLYQARGDGIRAFIAEQIRAAGPGAVVLAHSLGGIACVDLLVREEFDLRLLITVGSQAPLLYEIGALTSLEPGEPLPQHFPRWVNVYDPRDLLAYVGAQVFPGRVHDVRVDNRVGFPDSHGAYWTNPAVVDTIRELITA